MEIRSRQWRPSSSLLARSRRSHSRSASLRRLRFARTLDSAVDGRAGDPWEYEVILMDATPTTWTYKRDTRISLPAEEILWTREGISYLRPEIQLL
jgi:hypothetical protein